MSPGKRCDEIVRIIDESLQDHDWKLVGTTTHLGCPIGPACVSGTETGRHDADAGHNAGTETLEVLVCT